MEDESQINNNSETQQSSHDSNMEKMVFSLMNQNKEQGASDFSSAFIGEVGSRIVNKLHDTTSNIGKNLLNSTQINQ